jgi:SAM-dependent methyltransferase
LLVTTTMGSSWEDAVKRLLADPHAATLVRDCYYDAPLEVAAERYYTSDEWIAIHDLIGEGPGTALDVGAGNGIVSYALARDQWSVSALEPDPSELVGAGAIRTLARYAGADIRIVESFGEDVGLPSESFDLIVARQVVHHTRNIDDFFCEMFRLLRRGGTFFSFRDHVADNDVQRAQFFAEHPLHRFYGGENAFSEAQYRAALVGAGFEMRRQWGHFGAAFNFAPMRALDVARGAAGKLLPPHLADAAAKIMSSPMLYPMVGAILSRLYRHPGRHVAFLAWKR